MGDGCCCYTDNVMLLLVSGVFQTLLGMIVGVFYLTIQSMTDSVEYAESAIPTYVTAAGLILTGIMVMLLFKKRHKILVLITLFLTIACIFFCVCSTILVSLQVIPFLESLTHCVSRPIVLECQCYIIENVAGLQNSTSNIIDVGESKQFTFYGTKSCDFITTTIIDILYTESVIYSVGALTAIMAMVICILLLCGERHPGKRLRDGDFDVLTDDRSTTTSIAARRSFSRRILIPGHSYTLGSRQSQNFLRPPYASYLQDEDHMYLLSAMNGNNNRNPDITTHRPTSTMTTSLGQSSEVTVSQAGSSMRGSTHRSGISSVNDRSTSRRIPSVSQDATRRSSSRAQRQSGSQNPHNSNTANFSAMVGLHDLQSGRQQPRRITSQTRTDAVQRQRSTANGSVGNGHAMREGYVQGYDGNVVPVYAIPGSNEVFVNLRDLQSVQMPYVSPYDFPPTYADTHQVDDPPPYSSPVRQRAAGQRNATETSHHGNQTRNSNTTPLRQQDTTVTNNHGNQTHSNTSLSRQQNNTTTRSSNTSSLPRQHDSTVTSHHGNHTRSLSSSLPSAVPLVDSVFYMSNNGQNNLSGNALNTDSIGGQNYLRNITEDGMAES
ncbi:uncharacterized protein LOC144450008 [Glandiceps talaboti]